MISDVHQAITTLLNEMELLSEAPAAKLESSPGKRKPSSALLAHNGPVLHDLWLERFKAAADDPVQLERLLWAGRAALELRRHGPPKIHDQQESAEFILAHYEGVDPATVAAIESERGAHCHTEYVIWLRRRNDMTDMGYPRPASDRRTAMVLGLRAEGMSQMKIADQLGVSQTTVSRVVRDAQIAVRAA